MTELKYKEAIKEAGKFVILTETSEVYRIFNTEREAEEYCSKKMRLTANNRIDLYITTGLPVYIMDNVIVRADIKTYKILHIGVNW